MDDLSYEQGALAALESFRASATDFATEFNGEENPHAALLEILDMVIAEQRRSTMALAIWTNYSKKV